MDDFRIWERVITPNEVQQLYNGVLDENVTISGVVTDSTTVPGSVIMWVLDENGNKLAEQILPNGPGAYSFSLVRGHSYDVKAFRDGNGNGSVDPGIGEPYAHWGSWNGNRFDLLPVDGNKTGIDISLSGNLIRTTMGFHFGRKQWRVHRIIILVPNQGSISVW